MVRVRIESIWEIEVVMVRAKAKTVLQQATDLKVGVIENNITQLSPLPVTKKLLLV
jgi:hypothetical protein